MLFNHGSKGLIHNPGQYLRHELNNSGLYAPEISHGLGHFDPDSTASDYNCFAYPAFCKAVLYGYGLMQAADGKDAIKVISSYGKYIRPASRGQHQLIIWYGVLFRGAEVLNMEKFLFQVDR